MENANAQKMEIATLLDKEVLSVIGNEQLQGFEKAYKIADAVGQLKSLLTSEYMVPIMNLQGNRLGFRTDKDRSGGYPIDVVKDCLIEAVLMGVQPVGNQFNIIAGNSYITKEGFGYLLSKIPGLWYEIIPELPRINGQNTSAAIVMNVSWSLNNGQKKERKIEIPIKVNNMMGTDAIIGKATRKSRAWLYNTITGSEISDGDINDFDSKAFRHQTIDAEALESTEEETRALEWIEKAASTEDLEMIEEGYPDMPENVKQALEEKKVELKKGK